MNKQSKVRLLMLISIFSFVLLVSSIIINGGIRPVKNEFDKIAVVGGGVNLDKIDFHDEVSVETLNIVKENGAITDKDGKTTSFISSMYNEIMSSSSTAPLLVVKAYEDSNALTDENLSLAIKTACETGINILHIVPGIDENFKNSIESVKECINKNVVVTTTSNPAASALFNPLARLDGVIFIGTSNESIEGTNVIVGSENQISCLGKSCKLNQNSYISAGYVVSDIYKDIKSMHYEQIMLKYTSLVYVVNYSVYTID